VNDVIMILYYVITAFFAVCLAVNFTRTKDPQRALLFLVVLMPFVMRLARLK
jgi:ABC-type Fe3+ transport system permease subunit